jgi:hypothetical protein
MNTKATALPTKHHPRQQLQLPIAHSGQFSWPAFVYLPFVPSAHCPQVWHPKPSRNDVSEFLQIPERSRVCKLTKLLWDRQRPNVSSCSECSVAATGPLFWPLECSFRAYVFAAVSLLHD